MDLRNRKMGSSGSSGSGLFPNGLELKVVLEGEKDPIPLSHIPTDVTFHYLKELLRHSNAQLKEGKSWEDVEFYTDEDFFFPLPDKTTLSGAKILSGQTLYLAYKEDNSPSNQDSREGREFQVIIPMRVRPIKFKDLPPWATVGGLKKLLKSMCEPTEINRRNFWIRKEKDERDMAVPDSVLLSRLKTNVVVVESELNSWEELQKPTKSYSIWVWIVVIVAVLIVAVVIAESVAYARFKALGMVISKLRMAVATHG